MKLILPVAVLNKIPAIRNCLVGRQMGLFSSFIIKFTLENWTYYGQATKALSNGCHLSITTTPLQTCPTIRLMSPRVDAMSFTQKLSGCRYQTTRSRSHKKVCITVYDSNDTRQPTDRTLPYNWRVCVRLVTLSRHNLKAGSCGSVRVCILRMHKLVSRVFRTHLPARTHSLDSNFTRTIATSSFRAHVLATF